MLLLLQHKALEEQIVNVDCSLQAQHVSLQLLANMCCPDDDDDDDDDEDDGKLGAVLKGINKFIHHSETLHSICQSLNP